MSRQSSKPIRILILDEQKVFRQEIRLLLESQGKMQVVGDTGDCGNAVSLAGREQPDVILMGLDMGDGQDPVGCFSQLHAATPKAHILVLTGVWDP
jgi:DNA-binding NarL/FixJ family response regulator